MKYLTLLFVISLNVISADLIPNENYLIMYKEAVTQFRDSGIIVEPGIYLAKVDGVLKRPDLKNISSGDVFTVPGSGQTITIGYASGEIPDTRNEIWAVFNGKYFLIKDQNGTSKQINKGVPRNIISAVQGMYIVTASKKVIFRNHDTYKNTSLRSQNPVEIFEPEKKYYALSKNGRNLVYLTADLKVVLHREDGTRSELAQVTSTKRRGPQLSLTGDGVFVPEGSDQVRLIEFDRTGEVKSDRIVFRKRNSETILFSDNEIKIVQMRPAGGRAVFFLSRNGVLVPAQAGKASSGATLSASEINELLTFAEDWKSRAELGNFSNIVPDELLYEEIIAKLTAGRDTWVNLTGAFGVGKSSSLKGFAHYLANKKANDPLMGDYDLFSITMSGLMKLQEAAVAATKASPCASGGT